MSQLNDIQQEILRRFQRPPRQPMDERPDVQGGTQGGERFNPPQVASSMFQPPRTPVASTPIKLNPMFPQPMAGDSITPSAMPTTQRSALSQVGPPPPAMTWNPLQYKPSGEPEVSPTAKGNPLDIATRKRDALELWKPQGHRGVRQVLKEGAIGAAAAANANPNNPYAGLVGFGTGAVSGAIQPNAITRNFELNKSNQDIGRMLGEQHLRNTVDNAGMVPIQTSDGRTLMIPKAKVPDWENKQRTIAQGDTRLNLQRQRNDAYVAHLEDLPKEKQAEAARKMFMSGIGDGNPPLKAEFAKRMGITEELPDSDKGSVQTDAQGNFIIVHARGATAAPVTTATTAPDGTVTKSPVTSFKVTEEKNKTTRAQMMATAQGVRQQAQIDATAANEAANRGDRQEARRLDRIAKSGEVYGQYMGGLEMSRDKDSDTAAKGKRIMQAQRNALKAGYGDLYEFGSDGSITPKETVPASQSRGTWNPKAFARAFQVKHGRPPTQTEIDVYAKAAQQ